MSDQDREKEIVEALRRMPERDRKVLMIVVHLLVHDPAVKTKPLADLWETVSGEKLDPETRARLDAADAKHRPEVRH